MVIPIQGLRLRKRRSGAVLDIIAPRDRNEMLALQR